MPTKTLIAGLAGALLLVACSESASPTTTVQIVEETATTEAQQPVKQPVLARVGAQATVSGPTSGNRLLGGSSNLIDQMPVDIPVGGIPAWVVGVPGTTDPTWVVAHQDGTLEAWRLGKAGPQSIPLGIDSLPPGTPPLVSIDGDEFDVVVPPTDASPLTNPVGVADRIIYVTTSGNLAIADAAGVTSLEIGALPDARISVSSDGLVSVLAEPTDRYPHGVLGDGLEAGRVVVVDPATATVVAEGVVAAPSVIEGIAAPWVDADGDAEEELLVTISNSEVGARLALFDRLGEPTALGPPIGRGNRWRNQLAAGPVGPNGEIEVIDVRVPHIGGVVEYFRIEGDELVLSAEQAGFTSHVYGTRNLDMALATEVTGDNRIDILVPAQALTALGVLSRTQDGVEVQAELPLPGRLTTNVAGVTLADGSVAIAVGTSEGIVRIYPPG